MPVISLPRPVKIAAGNISPSRIIIQAAGDPDNVTQGAGATSKPVGVALPATKYPPGSTEDNGYAAVSGDQLPYYGEGDLCYVEAGATAITDFTIPLVCDANGRAVPASTIANWGTGSLALNTWTIGYPLKATSGNAGELVPVHLALRLYHEVV